VSRKPIDQQQPTECRQAIWNWIRQHPTKFQIGDIMYDIRLTGSSVKEYLTGLVNAGYLAVIKNPLPGVAAMYDLINDIGNDAPRVRKDGTPVTQGQGRQQMWNAMRILKTFSSIDLAFNASTDEHSVAEAEAKSYCGYLCRAGYLVGRSEGKFMLVPSMWTGPQPPQIQRTKQIYDPNLKRVVWAKIEGGAE
jgi:hypothetical protein